MGSTARVLLGLALVQPEPDDGSIVLFTDAAHYLLVGDRRDPNLLGPSLVPEATFGASVLYGSSPFGAAIMTSLSSPCPSSCLFIKEIY